MIINIKNSGIIGLQAINAKCNNISAELFGFLQMIKVYLWFYAILKKDRNYLTLLQNK